MNWTLEEIEDALSTLREEASVGAALDETIIARLSCFFTELRPSDPTLTAEDFWNVAEAVTNKRPDFTIPDLVSPPPVADDGVTTDAVGEWRTQKCQEALAQMIPSPLDRSLGAFRAFIRKEEEPI